MPYVTEMIMISSVILFDDDDNDEDHEDDDDDEYLLNPSYMSDTELWALQPSLNNPKRWLLLIPSL